MSHYQLCGYVFHTHYYLNTCLAYVLCEPYTHFLSTYGEPRFDKVNRHVFKITQNMTKGKSIAVPGDTMVGNFPPPHLY